MCVHACVHSVLHDVCLYAPLPYVNATWPWQEGPSTPMMWAAAALPGLEIKPDCRPRLLTSLSSSRSSHVYAWWFISSKSSLPRLFLPQLQGRLMMTLFTSKFVWLLLLLFFSGGRGVGGSYSSRRRKVRKPRKCFPTLLSCLLSFLLFNSFYNFSSWLIVFDLEL